MCWLIPMIHTGYTSMLRHCTADSIQMLSSVSSLSAKSESMQKGVVHVKTHFCNFHRSILLNHSVMKSIYLTYKIQVTEYSNFIPNVLVIIRDVLNERALSPRESFCNLEYLHLCECC